MLKKILMGAGVFLAAILLLSGIGLFVLRLASPGETEPILGPDGKPLPGSVATLEKINLGGHDQWILVRGEDVKKPVLLFLHGGPGSPEMFLFRTWQSALEKHFVVVNWDQRGAGKSYSKTIPASEMKVARFVEDVRELTELLRARFKTEKIYLMGHSWGSALGLKAASLYPELYYAWIGVGQVANMAEGEALSYETVLAEAEKRNDAEGLKKLKEIGPPPYVDDPGFVKVSTERSYVLKYGYSMHGESSYAPFMMPLLKFREYTIADKLAFFSGSMFTLERLWPELLTVDFFTEIPEVKIPFFVINGTYDMQTPTAVAKRYFDMVLAPDKEFFLFENSAHSPIYEEPERFASVLAETIVPRTLHAGGELSGR